MLLCNNCDIILGIPNGNLRKKTYLFHNITNLMPARVKLRFNNLQSSTFAQIFNVMSRINYAPVLRKVLTYKMAASHLNSLKCDKHKISSYV